MSFLGFTPGHVGAIYPGISLIETPLGAADSTAPNLDGSGCVVSSHCTLAIVHVYLFYDGVELGFWAFRFTLGIEEDLIGMLMTSYSTRVG